MSNRRVRVVLQARMSSSRLPGKSLLPLGGLPLAVLCARRLGRTNLDVILATSDDASDDTLAATASRYGVPVHRGSLRDVLSRFMLCTADLSDDDIVVRMTGDNPVPDGQFVEQLVAKFFSQDKPYLATRWPADRLPYGMSGEVFTTGILRAANQSAVTPYEREHVTPWIRSFVGETVATAPWMADDATHLRCTIDTPHDYAAMARVFMEARDPVAASWELLLSLLPVGEVTADPVQFAGPSETQSLHWLTLGTVQFGLNYGIVNRTGRPSDEALHTLLQEALLGGVTNFDTARAYGDAEERLGKELETEGAQSQVRVVTKLAPLSGYDSEASDTVIAGAVDASIFRSCHALRRRRLDVVMFHRPADMFQWNGNAMRRLEDLANMGVVGEIGASVYTPEEAIRCLEDARIRHLQIPLNLLDTRWFAAPFQDALRAHASVHIHARSVFLQGLLINQSSAWPVWFDDREQVVAKVRQLCAELGRESAADLCIAYVRSVPWITSLVLGVDQSAQLQELLALAAKPALSETDAARVRPSFATVPDRILNPSLW